MNRIECDGSYRKDLAAVTEKILERTGVYSPAAEREIMRMADEGNRVAEKLYADLIFYKKILRKEPYREAFSLYLKSAGITIDDGDWSFDASSYPLSFWIVGYYLLNYQKESVLQKCEPIEIIEHMSEQERLSTALRLAASCVSYIDAPGALNLIGRILGEAASSKEIFKFLQPVIEKIILQNDFIQGTTAKQKLTESEHIEAEAKQNNAGTNHANSHSCSQDQCLALSEQYFERAAEGGYVYACNNLAAREANRILALSADGIQGDELADSIEKYVRNLKLSADRYEPYAANRLGLFYMTGEIRGEHGVRNFREYVDFSLAKQYFLKATKYPDANSAWAYFNLIKYFHRDYDRNIELLNEHMDYIRILNPEIYDLAIEL